MNGQPALHGLVNQGPIFALCLLTLVAFRAADRMVVNKALYTLRMDSEFGRVSADASFKDLF